ncbi:hypothetical protein D3C85_1744000 [compost metagenome]
MGICGYLARTLVSSSKQPSGVVWLAKARRAAPWMVGPSATGSEKGMPSSRASAPPSTSASMMASDNSGVGSPSITNGTKAP